MYYIEEADKPSFIHKKLNILKLEDNKIILPVNEEISDRQAKKIGYKTLKILENTNCKKVILSKNIQKNEQYLNELYSYNLDIVDGKWLFEVLLYQILVNVIKNQKLKKEETGVSILVNDMSENIFENIKKIARNFKRVHIITNHIEKFKNIEKQFFEEKGIMITVGNNKRKSLSKSKIIINIDFPNELINEYIIYEEATIITLRQNIKIKSKRFNGKIISNYEISLENTEELEYQKFSKYNLKEIYEAQFYKKQPFESIMKKIEKDKIKVIL